jgi:hypothetical protein
VVSRAQLEELGLGRAAIRHRVERGRLHVVWPGVFAVGRPEVTREGRWMAAALTCGSGAFLSHRSAGELWGILQPRPGPITLSVLPGRQLRRRRGLVVHLVVETDGLRYHRTPAQQAEDRRRDQRHTVAGLTVLRFTHGQVTHEPEHVAATLRALPR